MNALKEYYKKVDMYGKDLTLTFNGEDKHTTYVGATLTTVVLVLIGIYSAFQFETMIKREDTTVNIKSIFQDLTKNYENNTMSDFGFDFAMQLSIFGEAFYDETYYNYEVENINSWWAPDENGIIKRYKTSTDLQMQP
jgi:hypothetical protein